MEGENRMAKTDRKLRT